MKRKVYIYIFVAVVVFAVAAAALMYFKPHPSVKNAEPAFTLSALELIDAFTNDEASATMLYGGKVLEVTGILKAISFSDSSMVLQMGDTNRIESVSCYVYNGKQAHYASLRPGKSVRVKGFCNGMLLDVILDKCILLSDDE
jgi:hypothetical protein